MTPRLRLVHLIGLWLMALAASAAVGTHGLLYWDAGDYVRLALDGGPSGLLLGRPLFLFISRLVLATGVEPTSAEPVLRWFWSAAGATAAPAMAVLASRLGLERAASIAAGAMLALSPSFAHTSHQVLTDAPALALSIAALAAAARSQAAMAGVLLAAAVLTRETAVVHVVALTILLGRRAVVALTVMGAAIGATLWWFPPPALFEWLHAMSRSTQTYPITAGAIGLSIVWTLAAGPIPVVAGMVAFARRPPGRWLVVSIPAAIATLALLFYPDGSFSPRYVLATAPLAFFLGASMWLAARPVLLTIALIVPLAAVPVATQSSRAAAARGTAVMTRLPNLPARALVVPGHYCPQARLAMTIHHRQDLQLVCPGWDWPADPAATLDAAIASGRAVAVDLAEDAWLGPREKPNRDAIHAWAAARAGRPIAGFVVIDR